ncbi:MAG: NAD(P)/FAD-dependent oxidoreductase, partial [Nanoarchaeota archaeon]|nr:NAD(P)/FAD-dependent oxidoreductase [Nanoarchaeota archaeon]
MISIIGAGPAGSYLGYLLAKNNKDVSIFEEHSKIGLPVQCTGIVTSSIKDIIKLKKDIITNEIGKARIFSPNNRFTEIKLKNKNIIIDREKFDSYIADMALRQGAKIFLNHRFIENKKNVAIIKDKTNSKTKKIRFDKLIGADGPLSPVAKSNNLLGKRRFWHGIQARAKIKNENIVEFYPYFGTFAWVVPENKETVRVGLISNRYTNVLFRNFLKLKDITNNKIIDYQSGLIPVYNPKTKTAKNNIYLLGDAA